MWFIRQSLKATFLVGASVVIALGSPLMVFADESSATANDSPTTSTPQTSEVAPSTPPSTTTQTTAPSSPVVSSPAPTPKAPEKTYSYDAVSGRWNSNKWTYDSAGEAISKHHRHLYRS